MGLPGSGSLGALHVPTQPLCVCVIWPCSDLLTTCSPSLALLQEMPGFTWEPKEEDVKTVMTGFARNAVLVSALQCLLVFRSPPGLRRLLRLVLPLPCTCSR